MPNKRAVYIVLILLVLVALLSLSWRSAYVVENVKDEGASSKFFSLLSPFLVGILIPLFLALTILEVVRRVR